jgi:hypothetical protein
MKTFTVMAAQGDLLILKVGQVLPGFEKQEPTDQQHIVAHSETGHHHVVDSPEVEYYTSKNDQMKAYLVVNNIMGTMLRHLRSFDTHETIHIPKGVYELRRQREYVPQGWRRVQD